MPRSPRQQAATAALYKKIVEMNESGLIDYDIARACGTSTATVSRARKSAGLKKKAPYKGFSPIITRSGEEWLKANYLELTDKQLGAKLGASAATVLKCRIRIGLRRDKKSIWSLHKHPRGFLGHTHSERAREKSRATSLAMWADPNHRVNSKEFRQERGALVSKIAMTRKQTNAYSSARRGYRADLGKIFFRSRWEANIARYLNLKIKYGEILKWEYECETFWFEKIRRGVRSYTPDFKVWATDDALPYFIEVKGWMDPKSKTKLKRMKKYHPNVTIKLIGEAEYKKIEKSVGRLIDGWEFKTPAPARAS